MLNVVMLSVRLNYLNAVCHYAECRYAEYYIKHLNAVCRYADCYCAECHIKTP
jgi:hypothetical protein